MPLFTRRTVSFKLLHDRIGIRQHLTVARIDEELTAALLVLKVEHVIDRVGNRIKRSLTNALSAKPVIFDETKNRRLIGHRMIDEVTTRPGRNDQQRQTRP